MYLLSVGLGRLKWGREQRKKKGTLPDFFQQILFYSLVVAYLDFCCLSSERVSLSLTPTHNAVHWAQYQSPLADGDGLHWVT